MTAYRRSFVLGGAYFFTINLAARQSRLLVDNIRLLRAAFREVRRRHPFSIDAIVVLPDHIHAIWTLPQDDSNFAVRWQLIKAGFSQGTPRGETISASRSRKRERGIWQRRYWEHTLRDEADFARHADYIHFNPVKHGHVGRVRDLPFSSFHRMVRLRIYPSDWADGPEDHEDGFGETHRSGEVQDDGLRQAQPILRLLVPSIGGFQRSAASSACFRPAQHSRCSRRSKA
jgi:putative transposase